MTSSGGVWTVGAAEPRPRGEDNHQIGGEGRLGQGIRARAKVARFGWR